MTIPITWHLNGKCSKDVKAMISRENTKRKQQTSYGRNNANK